MLYIAEKTEKTVNQTMRFTARVEHDTKHNKTLLPSCLYRSVWLNNGTINGTLVERDQTFDKNNAITYEKMFIYPKTFYASVNGKFVKIQPAGAPQQLYMPKRQPQKEVPLTKSIDDMSITIDKNHPSLREGKDVESNIYNSSEAALRAVQLRQYGNVQSLALKATISAVKLAINPYSKVANVGKIGEKIEKIDGNMIKISILESADSTNNGGYTETLKSILTSLQIYGHSKTTPYPENHDAQDLLSVATLKILESAYKIGIDPETWSTGYNNDGTPIVKTPVFLPFFVNSENYDTVKNGRYINHFLVGYKAVFSTVSNAVAAYIKLQKTRCNGKISVDAISMANNSDNPQNIGKIDFEDLYTKSIQKADQLYSDICDTLKEGAKNNDIAKYYIDIVVLLRVGYTQQEIANIFGYSQSKIAKDLAKVRKFLIDAGIN